MGSKKWGHVVIYKEKEMEGFTKEQLELRQLANECMDESLKILLEGKIQEAEVVTIRARDIYKEINDKRQLAAALNRLSVIYDELGDESMDLECLLDALELISDGDDYLLKAKLNNNLGSKFMYVKAYERALEHIRIGNESFQKACELDPSLLEKNHSFELVMNLNFSSIYYFLGDMEHSKRHYLLAKENTLQEIDEDLIFVFQCYEVLTLWRLGDKEECLALLDSVLETAKTIEYATDYLEVMSDILLLLKEMKDYKRWENLLHIIDNRLYERVTIKIKMEIVNRWIDFYIETGDEERYLQECKRFNELFREKTAEEYKKQADNIELSVEMRKIAKQKKQADSIVYLDPLTKTSNRNRMIEDSKKYIAESTKNNTPIIVGLIDIDFFKECNDTYGHVAGDKVLVKVAEIIKDAVGKKGNVYRYGGDEFLILLPNISKDDILSLGKDIQDKLATENIPNEKSAIGSAVTVSQGYTHAVAEEGDSIETLVNLADRVLYTVKRRGRNGYKFLEYRDVIESLM